MSDDELFESLLDEELLSVAHAPLGGVPSQVLSGVAWTRANITKLGIEAVQPRKSATYKIGNRTVRPNVNSMERRIGWKRELRTPVTLEDIRKRTKRPLRDYLVSVDEKGVLRSGFKLLDHDAVVAELTKQGYKIISTETLLNKANRTDHHESIETPPSFAAIVEIFEIQK